MADFEQLDALLIDPIIAQMFTKAREYEQLLNEADNVTDQERNDLIVELNSLWPYMRSPMRVSGLVSFASFENGQVSKTYYENERLISNGFTFVPDDIMVDDEIVATRFKVALHMIQLGESSTAASRGGVAHLDEVVVESPHQSQEMIENRLRYFHPDIMESIDVLVLNCNTEEDALLALKGFTIDVTASNPDDVQMISDIQKYLSVVLEFDSSLPYAATVSGPCYIETKNAFLPAMADDDYKSLLAIKKVQFLPPVLSQEEAKQTLIPCIEAALFKAAKSANPAHVHIPVTSIQEIQSIRRQMYDKS